MNKQTLHITNGGNLTTYLNDLKIEGEKLTWQEILCEGPTQEIIHCNDFIQARSQFLLEFYNVELDFNKVEFALKQLSAIDDYSEIVLWFEYDLFCHINMLAVINLLLQKKINLPLYLVCSGRVHGSKNLKGLNELNTKQLLDHYKNKIKLNQEDIDLAATIWGIYCGKDHNLLKPFIVKSSSFQYLSNCLKAHLERFPDSITGLNVLETNILKIIKENEVKSKHHLLGYALNYQGYYGFGDMQINRIIEKLNYFFDENESGLKLNRAGHEALLNQKNFSKIIQTHMVYGGVSTQNFSFSKEQNKLIKNITNAY
ncbi:DUF1835 domain-containing protein [Tamlana fucoidanivorans]|uniref:DUF1835 domain-containing protein n=1 Tax=Allotamlana fucoidanivorans TaxID=2583814 RepID=A0A5C4SEI2_9FLAO|nr:DUF1835 domain-containing protein [Tamlana fucoidanivorans]TNJ41690.1 DUF1835 domain-containing protein [Tamlana fucoidanivorans]